MQNQNNIVTPSFAWRVVSGASSTPTDPADLGDLLLWLRADIATLSSPVSNGDDVQEWSDLRITGDGVSAGSFAPVYRTAQINGHDAVEFTGNTNCFLRSNLGSFPALTYDRPFHVFAVMKQVAWTNNDVLFGGTSGSDFRFKQSNTTPKIRVDAGSGNSTENSGLAVGSWGIVELIVPSSGNISIRVNNGTATQGVGSTAGDRQGVWLGTNFGAGSGKESQVMFAEFLLYNVELSTTDADTTRAYLNGEYAIY